MQPPLVEHLDSLLTGTGHDLELQTFKVIDPLSGRLLGVRADITPQVARIDAHLLERARRDASLLRGSVLRTVAPGLAQTREVLQIGAELYGDAQHRRRSRSAGAAAVFALAAAGVQGLHLDLGHVGVYRALANGAHIAGNGSDSELFAALRTKDVPAIAELTAKLPAAWRDAFTALPTLYGPAAEVLAAARARLPDTPSIAAPCRRLGTLAESASAAGRRGCTSISRICAAIIIRPARAFRCSPPASRTPSAAANATTASAKRSAARGRRPDSRSTCASLRRLFARSRKRWPTNQLRRHSRQAIRATWARTSSSSAPNGVTKARARSSTG